MRPEPEPIRKMPQPHLVRVRVEPGYQVFRHGREFGAGEEVRVRPRDADRLARNGVAIRVVG